MIADTRGIEFYKGTLDCQVQSWDTQIFANEISFNKIAGK